MKLDRESLCLILETVWRGDSMEAASTLVGCSRRLIYQMIDHSRDTMKADQPTDKVDIPTPHVTPPRWTPYYFTWRGEASWFHLHMLRARDPYLKDDSLADLSDEELDVFGYRDRYIRDENGDRIRIGEGAEEPEPDRSDIRQLEELARAAPKNPRPIGAPVTVYGRERNDPVEHVTGLPPEVSQRDRERALPRAHVSINSDLKPQTPRPPPWEKPLPLDRAGKGQDEPPDTMRATVSTRSYSHAERVHHGVLQVHDGLKR
jgi:hypothetical protein